MASLPKTNTSGDSSRPPTPSTPLPAPKTVPPKKRRWWLQYGLRSLLLLMLAVALGSGWVSHLRRQYAKQTVAVERIKALDGSTWMRVKEPAWLRTLVGPDYVEVHKVAFDHNRIRNDDLACLADLPDLTALSLHGCRKIDSGAAGHLAGLKQMKRLSLHGTNFDDAGVAQLRELDQLEVLSLQTTNVSAAAVGHLAPFKNLRDLNLRNTAAKCDLVVKDFPNLQKLSVGHELEPITSITAANLPNLTTLTISSTRLTSDLTLRDLPKLSTARIGTGIANKALFENVPPLARLSTERIWPAKANDRSLSTLRLVVAQGKLTSLSMDRRSIAADDLAALSDLTELTLSRGSLQSEHYLAIRSLLNLRKLSSIVVDGLDPAILRDYQNDRAAPR